MDIEYKNFESRETDDPDFTVYLGDFTPSNEGCSILDNTYYIKKDYIYCKDSYKIGRWEIEVSGLEKKGTIIKLSTNLVGTIAADMFICAFIIDFLIRFKLERKGYSVVHASAIDKEGMGFLFPSQSGAGKSTTAIYFASDGYKYLGDDFVILHNGNILSYLTILNIPSYMNYKNLNSFLAANLSTRDKLLLPLNNFIYKLSFKYMNLYIKVNPKDLLPEQIVDISNLNAVFLLHQNDKFGVTEVSRERIINSLLINQKLESFPFFKYLLEYGYVFPKSKVANYWEKCRENLEKNLGKNVKFYRLNVPKKYNYEVFRNIKEEVNSVAAEL